MTPRKKAKKIIKQYPYSGAKLYALRVVCQILQNLNYELNDVGARRPFLTFYIEYWEEVKQEILKLMSSKKTKRTLVVYNVGKTTKKEVNHLMEILNCDDSTLWDNADHCGIQIFKVPVDNKKNNK